MTGNDPKIAPTSCAVKPAGGGKTAHAQEQRILPLAASVQTAGKPGYTKVPNHILAALIRLRASGLQVSLFLAAVRRCHGYHKPDESFSLRDLRSWFSPDRRLAFRTARELCERRMFVIAGDDKKRPKYRIQHDTRKWVRAYKGLSHRTSSRETTKTSSHAMTQSLYKKKIEIKEKETPLPPHAEKLPIFKKLAQIGVPDEELLELRRTKTKDELEAIFAQRASGGR